MSRIEQCDNCRARSAERSEEWGFPVETLCDNCRQAAVAKYQRQPMTGKKGNHVRENMTR